ncbi:hypothetical protein D3C83_56380 [compost metagenome]
MMAERSVLVKRWRISAALGPCNARSDMSSDTSSSVALNFGSCFEMCAKSFAALDALTTIMM